MTKEAMSVGETVDEERVHEGDIAGADSAGMASEQAEETDAVTSEVVYADSVDISEHDEVEFDDVQVGDTESGNAELGDAEPTVNEEQATTETPGDAEIILQLRAELAAAQALADESVDRMQRTVAEFQNSRLRQERQLANAIDRANSDLILRLLPVLDDLDLAFKNAPGDDIAEPSDEDPEGKQAWIEGFQQIQKKLLELLEEQGVTPIGADGEFDPSLHEAVLSEPSDEVESGHIIDVLRAGYEYKGQILRPAMVRVAA